MKVGELMQRFLRVTVHDLTGRGDESFLPFAVDCTRLSCGPYHQPSLMYRPG
jgi:hypothetical protein